MKKTHHTTEQIIRILREAETTGQSHGMRADMILMCSYKSANGADLF